MSRTIGILSIHSFMPRTRTCIGPKEYMMKIGNCTPASATAAISASAQPNRSTDNTRETTEASAVSDNNPSASTRVEVSDAASSLLDGQNSSFDSAKVDRIRQAIADGSYKANPEAIADRLLANAQDLLGNLGPRF